MDQKMLLLTRFSLFPLLCLFSLGAITASELEEAPEGTFTIVAIPDTQGYFGQGTKRSPASNDPVTNPVFENHVRWVRDNLEAQRIVFVTHVGDIVDRNNEAEWSVARHCLDVLHGVVPYSLTVGNHDMTAGGDSSLFQQHFGAKRYRGFPWYGGDFEPDRSSPAISGNNANCFQLFRAEGLDFIHVSLECNAPDDVLAWANELLTRYGDRRALITTHMDLGVLEHPRNNDGFIHDPKGRMRWIKCHGDRGNTAVEMWDKLYRKHANLAFVFSGDQSRCTALRLDQAGDHGNQVHSLLSDYTSTGPLRLYRFIPAENKVRVITYDTTLRELTETTEYVKNRKSHQFTIPYLMRSE